MKANELNGKNLMVGDWVVYEGDTNYDNPIRIEGMDIATKSLITSDREDVRFDGIEPIPLTAEILEKNGWKWNAFYTMLDLVIGTIHIGWGFYKDCLSVSDWSDEGHCQISSLRCIYVHELQHALRLCGIEKEIVL